MIHKKPQIYRKLIPFGLSFIPTLEPDISDNKDYFDWYTPFHHDKSDNSPEVLEIVKEEILKNPPNILEIGVSLYNKESTITWAAISNKNESSYYIGIDIKDRKFVKDWGKNCHFIEMNSSNYSVIKSEIEKITNSKIGTLIIDGNHSVNGILKDWEYVNLLHDDGSVLIHDSNTHPGPVALLEAIDRTKFSIKEPLFDKEDHGIAIIRKNI